jgi:NTP pyrophosphatase (non-canonical NTP hydrolase)
MRDYREANLREEVAQTIFDLLALSEMMRMDLPKEINQKPTILTGRGKSII